MRGSYRLIMERLRAAPGLHLSRARPARPRQRARSASAAPGSTEHLAAGGGDARRGGGVVRRLPRLRQRPRTVRRGDRPRDRRGAGELPAGLQPRRADQRRAGDRGAPARGASAAVARRGRAARSGGAVVNWLQLAGVGVRGDGRADDPDGGQRGARHHAHEHPYMLGTMFTPNRDRAKVYGVLLPLRERLGVLDRLRRRVSQRAHLHLVVRRRCSGCCTARSSPPSSCPSCPGFTRAWRASCAARRSRASSNRPASWRSTTACARRSPC